MTDKLLCNKREAAAALGISIRLLEGLLSLKELRSVRIGRRRSPRRDSPRRQASRSNYAPRICRIRSSRTVPSLEGVPGQVFGQSEIMIGFIQPAVGTVLPVTRASSVYSFVMEAARTVRAPS